MAAVELPENLGIPGGRNAGVRWLREHGGADIVLVLDDDGLLPRTDTLHLVREAFTANPKLGIVGFRIADENGVSQRRHVPRLGGADPLISGPVTTFLGGAHAIRMDVIDQVGDFPDKFFYAHEETDFAWRALDAGWEIDYRADLVLTHPGPRPRGTRSTTTTPAATGSGSRSGTCPPFSSRSTSPPGRRTRLPNGPHCPD